MNRHLEIAERLAQDQDWGLYAGALCRRDMVDLTREYRAVSDELRMVQSRAADREAEIERLRAAYEAPPTSLTLDDLKQMEGEPVYIQYGDGKEGWDHVEDGLPIWLESDPDFINMTCSFDKDGHFGLHVLGWQAFRRRPEAARAAWNKRAEKGGTE